jgi:hypothetical protein
MSAEKPKQPGAPLFDLDADPHNANWLRILAKRREQQPAPKKPPQSPK